MSLRNKLIRLAYEQPQLRADILPLIKSAKKVQVVNRETGNTVSVNEETLKDPEKKKLYAPVEENSEKNDDGASGSSSASKSNIFKEQSKRKSDLEKWVEENDVDDILSELDFDDIMDLENEWEDALYNLEEEDEDKAEEFKKKMEEFFKGEEKQMEIRDKIETMSDDLENDDSSKGKFVLKMLDGMGADPEDQLQNLKDVLFYVKGGYEQRKKRKDKLNKDTIDQIKTFEREEVSKSMGKFHLSKEDQQKALEEYIGEIERVMGGETKSKGKKATLRSSLIRLAYTQPQLRGDLLPLLTKSARALQPSKSGIYTLSFFVGLEDTDEAFNATDREHKKQFAKAMGYTKKLFSKYNTKWNDERVYVTVNTQELKEISALLSRMWKGGDSIRIQVAPFYGLSDFMFYYGTGSRNKTPVSSSLKAVLQFSKTAKTAGKHYDRWEMWSKLLKRSGLIVEIEKRPMPMYVTELKVFYSRHKQFHNVDTLMGDIYATIGYDRNGTEFTVHTGNKSSGYTVGDEKYALKDLIRYFK